MKYIFASLYVQNFVKMNVLKQLLSHVTFGSVGSATGFNTQDS